MTTRFVPSLNGLDIVTHSEDSVNGLTELAALVVNTAKSLAPRLSGDYADSIAAEIGEDEKGDVVARINANDFKASWIEFGTSDTPAFAPLRRGAEAAGLKVVAS